VGEAEPKVPFWQPNLPISKEEYEKSRVRIKVQPANPALPGNGH